MKRPLRIPLALAWTALAGGGLGVVISCSGTTEPTCATCADAALDQTDQDVALDGPAIPDGSVPTEDAPTDVTHFDAVV